MADYGRLLRIIVDYSGLRYFMAWYDVLSHFISFYHFFSMEMPKNDQKWSWMSKNVCESPQKFAQVYESQHLLWMKWKKAILANNVAHQRSLGTSLGHGWVTHGPSVQNGTPFVHCGTHTFCQPFFSKTIIIIIIKSIYRAPFPQGAQGRFT